MNFDSSVHLGDLIAAGSVCITLVVSIWRFYVAANKRLIRIEVKTNIMFHWFTTKVLTAEEKDLIRRFHGEDAINPEL